MSKEKYDNSYNILIPFIFPYPPQGKMLPIIAGPEKLIESILAEYNHTQASLDANKLQGDCSVMLLPDRDCTGQLPLPTDAAYTPNGFGTEQATFCENNLSSGSNLDNFDDVMHLQAARSQFPPQLGHP